MIKSMTGFGRGEYTDGKRNIIVEIRAVNHRYSDITIKMPRRYSFAEDKIKNTVKDIARRGKIEVSVMVENITEDDTRIKLSLILVSSSVIFSTITDTSIFPLRAISFTVFFILSSANEYRLGILIVISL